jgi:cell division septation protein DedD
VTVRPWLVGAVALALVLAPAPTSAQETTRLDRVEELARVGRTEDARDVLREWWDVAYQSASRKDVQEALWLRGRLAAEPARAALDFRRLVVEFPGGIHSDDALLRLAQAAFAAGDSAAAARDVHRLATEYPGSDARHEGEAWLAAAGSPPPAYRAADHTRTEEAPARRPDDTRRFSVQLGAFSERARAAALRDRAVEAGLQARLAIVPGSPLVRVRVGRFDSAEAARDILRLVRDEGFTATLVKDAHLEGRFGG